MHSILLVSGTTIVGLAPLLVHMNDTADKDIWENLALATIGGLTSSTLLLLLLTPAFYTTTVRLSWVARRFAAWLGAKAFRRAGTQAAAPSAWRFLPRIAWGGVPLYIQATAPRSIRVYPIPLATSDHPVGLTGRVRAFPRVLR